MKAVRVHAYQQDPKIDDIPEPKLQGPLDVIVKVGGAGVCRTDLHIVNGDWADIQNPDLPYVIGHENAGWVHEVGEAVTNVAVGDTVILHPQPSCGLCLSCRAGRDMQCTGDAFFPGLSNNDGGMAEFMRTTARSCVKLDPSTKPADVAALADAGITSYHAVRKAVPYLYPGTTAVVIGAGGLGHIGIQCLTALTAAKVIVVDKNPAALELAKQIGADETVVADGSQVQAVQDLTGGGGTVVFDYVAEEGVELEAWQMTGPAGYQFNLGYGGEFRAPTLDFVAGEKNVIGNIVGTYNDLAELMVLAQAGKVTLHTKQYPLDSALDALHELEVRRHSFTAEGDSRDMGSELSPEGVREARRIGDEIGEVACVVTSQVRRTTETALAMGFAVDEVVEMASGYVAGVVRHHEQWTWAQPYIRYAALLRNAPGLITSTQDQLQLWQSTVRRVPEGCIALVISHGGIIEPALVAALPEADHATWGAPFANLDGARLSFDGGRFAAVEFLRALK